MERDSLERTNPDFIVSHITLQPEEADQWTERFIVMTHDALTNTGVEPVVVIRSELLVCGGLDELGPLGDLELR